MQKIIIEFLFYCQVVLRFYWTQAKTLLVTFMRAVKMQNFISRRNNTQVISLLPFQVITSNVGSWDSGTRWSVGSATASPKSPWHSTTTITTNF